MRVEKENLKNYIFIKEDVISDIKLQKRRYANIQRAVKLGNGFKNKVKIFFRTKDNDLYFVETTVWGAGKEYIELKGGVNIPIQAIEKIDFS